MSFFSILKCQHLREMAPFFVSSLSLFFSLSYALFVFVLN